MPPGTCWRAGVWTITHSEGNAFDQNVNIIFAGASIKNANLDRGSAARRDSNLVFLDRFLNWPPFLFSYALLFIEAFDPSPIRRVSPTVAGCPELQDNHYTIVIAFVLKMKFGAIHEMTCLATHYSSNKKALFESFYDWVGAINVHPNYLFTCPFTNHWITGFSTGS